MQVYLLQAFLFGLEEKTNRTLIPNLIDMCCNFSIVKKTENGQLILLKGCGNYQLTFKNLTFNLTKAELQSFHSYLKNIDIEYWEKEYEHSIYEKKIPIPTLQSNLIILINRYEIYELITLLQFKTKVSSLQSSDINYTIIWN